MNYILFHHQGWTDIINSLALITWYGQKHDILHVLMHADAAPLLNYYLRNTSHIIPIYVEKSILDNDIETIIPQNNFFLGIGGHDRYRTDNYQNSFSKHKEFFVERFYTAYDIPYIARVEYFQLDRDLELEQRCYNEFVERYGDNYILTHHVELKNTSYSVVSLTEISDIFFDMIMVLQKAKELHLIDSVWAAVTYLLDAKYGLFSHIKIYIHARAYQEMFTKPVKLDNWTIY